MKNRWFKPEETVTMACPLSVGQAEAGRYTYCVASKCMAWQWLVRDEDKSYVFENEEPDEGWEICSEPYDDESLGMIVDTIRTPTHGRCGMVPLAVKFFPTITGDGGSGGE